METRNVAITLEKAKEWYRGNDLSLKKIALQAFTKEELEEFNFKNIVTFDDAIRTLNLDIDVIIFTLANLQRISKASAAFFKLNIIRRALNKGEKIDFREGVIWYPYTPALLFNNKYCKSSYEVEIAKVKINHDIFSLLGGGAYQTIDSGFGDFEACTGIAGSYTVIGFLGCATKEIAQHMGKYFGKEIFMAKYGDTIDFQWIQAKRYPYKNTCKTKS